MLKEFAIKKEFTLQQANKVVNDENIVNEVLKESGLKEKVNRLEQGLFRIALVAPFSAGKSTFINGLIGKDLLSVNILAETAAITVIKYSEEKRIEIHYKDGTKDIFPTDGSEPTDEELKQFLKIKTAVQRKDGETVEIFEEKIDKVEVYWDLPICEDGVELVDTPGLFSAYDQHSQLTNNILPTINAVLFVVEPHQVGQKHFMEVIQDRVEEAKNSRLEEEGRHIFFIINKIDKYPTEEVEKAEKELINILKPILAVPNIFKVSSYFAVKARMFKNNEISIDEIQKDTQIRFTDEEGFPVAGRGIQEQHIPEILNISNFLPLEKALSDYLSEKNDFLISDVLNTIQILFDREIEGLKQSIEIQNNAGDEKREYYIERLAELKDSFGEMLHNIQDDIEETIHFDLFGSSSSSGGLKEISEKIEDEEAEKYALDLEEYAGKFWNTKSVFLDEDNAVEMMNEVADKINSKINIFRRQLTKNSFDQIEQRVKKTANKVVNLFEQFEVEVNKSFEDKLDLSKKDHTSFLDVNALLEKLRYDLEKNFSKTLIKISKKLENEIANARRNRVSYRDKPGVWNWFKSWFGKQDTERMFDEVGFRKDVSKKVRQMVQDGAATLREEASEIAQYILDESIREIIENFQHTIAERISSYNSWRKRMLKGIEKDLAEIEQTKEEVILQYEDRIKELQEKKVMLREEEVNFMINTLELAEKEVAANVD
ncbi:dynamin family protein [Gracilibacillus lacisalsi]|uniref:dynamin family protein n=1 Tax=Gracilibacillus lacisalsi TaxID=393087 RepID=UPI00037EBD78|nr:dynamin family protein [Gracilibacillus lacisalsi]